jgi:hypothetical protein
MSTQSLSFLIITVVVLVNPLRICRPWLNGLLDIDQTGDDATNTTPAPAATAANNLNSHDHDLRLEY